MTRTLWSALVAAVVAAAGTAACGVRPEPALPAATPEALGLARARLDTLDRELSALVEAGRLAGIHAVIARHGRIGYERTFGWADLEAGEALRRDAIFRIYSMTKPVVAAGVLCLVDEGLLGLDDPVSRYIPAFAHVKVLAGGTADAPVLEDPASPITIRQLLNHTSGLAYGLTEGPADTIFTRARLYDASLTLEQFADSLARLPLLFEPGTEWSYGSGFDVAGRVIEVASGQSLDRFLDERIFRPLGMRDTGFRIRPGTRGRLATVYTTGADGRLEARRGGGGLAAMFEPEARFLWGSGGLLSTPDDYLRFGQMLLNGGTLGETRILRPETVALMRSNTLPPGLTPIEYGTFPRGYGFGVGVAVKVDTVGADRPGPAGIFRWSGYLGTYFWVDPANDVVAMVWTQHSPGPRQPLEERFQELLYRALRLPQ